MRSYTVTRRHLTSHFLPNFAIAWVTICPHSQVPASGFPRHSKFWGLLQSESRWFHRPNWYFLKISHGEYLKHRRICALNFLYQIPKPVKTHRMKDSRPLAAIPRVQIRLVSSPSRSLSCVSKREKLIGPDYNLSTFRSAAELKCQWEWGKKSCSSYQQLSLSISLKLAVIGWSDGSTSHLGQDTAHRMGKCTRYMWSTPARTVPLCLCFRGPQTGHQTRLHSAWTLFILSLYWCCFTCFILFYFMK